MRKIKGFKLNLRVKEVQRRAKKVKLDLGAIGLGDEPSLTKLAEDFSKKAKPSVVYDSFSPDGAKGPAEAAAAPKVSPLPGLAYSLAVATLGADADAFIEERCAGNESLRPVLGIMAQTALDEAARFVTSLLEEEAKAEQCELSPLQYATDAAALQSIVGRLEAHKINVATADAGLRPTASCAFGLSWVARTKSRAR
ncbi:MAG: hypothetical protein HY078_04600 [Elusimicrobia bacterium]|nr:hypothetical protein [Elusimicrobiota bacterium]